MSRVTSRRGGRVEGCGNSRGRGRVEGAFCEGACVGDVDPVTIRWDIAYSVSVLSRYLMKPNRKVIAAARRVIYYCGPAARPGHLRLGSRMVIPRASESH